MTACSKNTAWPSWVVFLIECEKAHTYLLDTAATELQHLVIALPGFINHFTWGLLFRRRGLRPADPLFGERDFHCGACHPQLKRHPVLRPSNVIEEKCVSHWCFHKGCAAGEDAAVPCVSSLPCSHQALFTRECSIEEFQFAQVTGLHCGHTRFTNVYSPQTHCVSGASKRLIKSVEKSQKSVLYHSKHQRLFGWEYESVPDVL